jgi:hypothetical protein|tara:strand:+ start:115 stop:816 length:702 start_codon:yes stop_codon:yes gene_type:complete
MAGFTYATLTTAIQNYTEVGTSVLSSTITDQFIDNSELRIQRDIPIDADRKEMLGNLTASKDNVYAPAGTLFIRGLQVYTSTTAATGANSWLEKKDISYLREYDAAETTTGTPKYYAMSGGADGTGATSSGRITIVPTPSSAFMYKIHYNARPTGLSSANTTSYLSLNFGNGLLYACLVEAFSYLKGPMDMLQLYEQKYQTEIQKFGGEQIGRRRRDDYTDGEPRIPVQSPTP